MTTAYEFGTRAEANDVRDEYADHLADADDRRLKKVRLADSLPDDATDTLEARAAASRAERQSGPGQAELTDAEKKRVGPFSGSNNYRKAAAVKALLTDAGVDDWTAYYDSTLTVDEHESSVLPTAKRDDRGGRNEDEETDEQRAARLEGQAKQAATEQCDHARDACQYGDKEACEFLGAECGLDEPEIEAILSPPDDTGEAELTGRQYGALSKLWTQFTAGLGDAKQAAAAINEIRERVGQDPLAFDELGGRTITTSDLE